MSTKLEIGMTVVVTWSKGKCVGVINDFIDVGVGCKWVKVAVQNGFIISLESQCKPYNGCKLDGLLDL